VVYESIDVRKRSGWVRSWVVWGSSINRWLGDKKSLSNPAASRLGYSSSFTTQNQTLSDRYSWQHQPMV
jgi:hypothetical protein